MSNVKSIVILTLGLTVCWETGVAAEEGILLDPNTGNYAITYRGSYDPNELQQVVFVPATKIDPSIRSRFKEENDVIVYRYVLRNARTSKQDIDGFNIVASHASEVSAPKGWSGGAEQNIGGSGFVVGWFYRSPDPKGLAPGKSEGTFRINSKDLPGIDHLRLNGATPVQGFPDAGPSPESAVGKQFKELKANDFVVRYAAVPLIPVPTPFDATAVLTSLQKHVKEDLVGMALVDPILVSKLDPLFVSAIESAQRGNAEGTRKTIKDIRHLLKREHEDVDKDEDNEDDDQDDKKKDKDKNKRLIDKLAAKVLDFDLKYVEKRVKGMLDESLPPVSPPSPTPPPDVTPPVPPRETPGVF